MNIINKFPEDMDNRTQYKLIKSPAKKMSDAVDSLLEVKSWILYEDLSNTGEVIEVLSIQTEDGEIFATISDIFKKEFGEIVKFFGNDVGMIKVIGRISRSGRKYITCMVE